MISDRENPFATRFIWPGQQYVEPPGCSEVGSLASHFLRKGGYGQIVGPHGCGKTSLAWAMTKSLRAEFREIHFLVIRRSAKWGLRGEMVNRLAGQGEGELWVVDGLERLSLVQRFGLVGHCRVQKKSLLVTAHQTCLGLPVLARLLPSLDHFQEIVQRLSAASGVSVETETVRLAYDQNDGDYREGLMFLYDAVQPQVLAAAC